MKELEEDIKNENCSNELNNLSQNEKIKTLKMI